MTTRRINLASSALALCLSTLLLVLTSQHASAAVNFDVDRFETYSNNQAIGTAFDSFPWLRLGGATADNVVAKTDAGNVLAGSVSGLYPLDFANGGFGSARRHYNAATDFSEVKFISILLKSSNPSTTTNVKLVFSDGTGAFESNSAQLLSNTVQSLLFPLNNSSLSLVDGSGAFASAISQITSIGFTFTTAGSYAENVLFDNAVALVPEPATGILAAAGAALLAFSRKTRKHA